MNLVCPYCSKTNDRHGRVDKIGHTGPSRPVPGSVSLCVACGGISVMTDHLALRKATADEVAQIQQDPTFATVMEIQKNLQNGP